MRTRSGCEACRIRHRKCVFPSESDTCFGCLEKGQDCRPPARFVFMSPGEHSPLPPSDRSGREAFSLGSQGHDDQAIPQMMNLGSNLDENPTTQVVGQNGDIPISSPAGCQQENADPCPVSPSEEGSELAGKTSASSRLSIPRSFGTAPVSLTEREGQLFSLYARQLAPMMDSCDDARHFTLAIPRLALHEPMLLNSILALAGRYDALHRRQQPDLDAVHYSSHTIEALIERLARPPETYDPELLAAVVIARSYEECDFEDDRSHHHLSGLSKLLSYATVVRLASEGGLAEAACWVHLRQAVYAYVVRRRPVDSHLDAFKHLPAFLSPGDSAYSNRIVYYFAQLLKLFLPSGESPCPPEQADAWEHAQTQIETWFDEKPPCFSPVRFVQAEDGEDSLPNILMLGAAPVMGLQYYYASLIVLLMKECNSSINGVGFDAVRARKQHESLMAANMTILMGLAVSNDHVLDSFLLPTHMLSLCGYCMQNQQQRDTAVRFLRQVNGLVAWRTDPVIASLSAQWAEYDTLYGVAL